MCSSADPSRKTGILFSNRTVIPTGGIMGLWPTQGDEKHLDPASTRNGAVTLSLSSRPERSAVEGPAVPRTFLETSFEGSRSPTSQLSPMPIMCFSTKTTTCRCSKPQLLPRNPGEADLPPSLPRERFVDLSQIEGANGRGVEGPWEC